MPWLIGVDEAGYGPNLGPFVMSSVAVYVTHKTAKVDLWQLLSAAVCRACDADDLRLIVDDSKAVYVAAVGLSRLERNLWPFACDGAGPLSLTDYWQRRCLTGFSELQAEPWYADGLTLPLLGEAVAETARARLAEACSAAGVVLGPILSVAVFPRQVNELIDRQGSKGAVPAWALGRLLAQLPEPRDDEPTRVYVDKLGGRNFYREILQTIFPASLVLSREESADWSSYRVRSEHGACDVSFSPKADGRHFPVALASMASKYLREVLMEMFNRFWQQHVPDLERTAGYPGDAERFYKDISAARRKLKIAPRILWRKR